MDFMCSNKVENDFSMADWWKTAKKRNVGVKEAN